MVAKKQSTGKKERTLPDVIACLKQMEQRVLTHRLEEAEAKLREAHSKLQGIEVRLNEIEASMTKRIEAMETKLRSRMQEWENDMTSTLRDSLKTRKTPVFLSKMTIKI